MPPTLEMEAAPNGRSDSAVAPSSDSGHSSGGEMQNEIATRAGVMDTSGAQTRSAESSTKLQFISLETISVSKDGSTVSRIDDERDEVVLFDASAIWSAVPTPQRALLSSLQLPIEQLPRRSSPLPSIHGDEVTEPNISQIRSMVPDGSGHLASESKWNVWKIWDFCVLSCLRQCGPFHGESKSGFDCSN